MSLEVALLWTERLTALALVLQSLELLQLRRAFADDGVWRWSILRDEQAGLLLPLRWVLALLLPYRAFVGLLVARIVLAALFSLGHGLLALPLLLSQLLVCARFRGTFNGGSDYMTVVLLLGTSVAALPGAARVGLGYICVQLVMSYFIAGITKLRQPAWRSGSALATFLRSPRYAAPAWVGSAATPGLALVASWSVMVFEVGFPWALTGLTTAWCAALLGVGFHLANAVVFGLNRFLFAWTAAYPALLYFAAALAWHR